jgi:hypothetical protein
MLLQSNKFIGQNVRVVGYENLIITLYLSFSFVTIANSPGIRRRQFYISGTNTAPNFHLKAVRSSSQQGKVFL